jgi:tRNA-splicing ligase RtcB
MPQEWIKRPNKGGFIHFKTKYGVDQQVSVDHRMLFYLYDRSYGFSKWKVYSAEEVLREHSELALGFRHRILTAPEKFERFTGVAQSADALRVAVMICADGHIYEKGDKVRLSFKKQRKITRALELLEAAGIEVSHIVENTVGVTNISFVSPIREKSLAQFWEASPEQLKVIADEVVYWDGNLDEQVYYTRDKASADFVQYAFFAGGYRAVMRQDGEDYRVYRHLNTKVGLSGTPKTEFKIVPHRDGSGGYEYCFKVPSTFFIIRRGGNIAITGNCGMTAVKTKFSAEDLPDNLKETRENIERRIPLGAGGRNRELQKSAEPRYRALTSSPYYNRDEDYNKLTRDWHLQLGSLGSGNHFIEICLDEEARVWVMLHSGSRGIGNRLADRHIKIAQELMRQEHVALPDRDLAYLNEGTPAFAAYIRDLLWAQDFALLNREEMMDRVMTEISYLFFKENGHQREIEVERINCHHNFTEKETHDGQSVWVTRKGAIRMRREDRGVIPGSMGTRSYIVSGLQNDDAFHSAPHGAGRRFSRGEARRRFNMDDFDRAMKGIEHRRAKELIDELPEAYKDIDAVMENSKELVKVDHVLKQVLNVKGD